MVDEFNRDSFINMNQSSIYIDPEAHTTYSEIGFKRVLATTADQEQTRVSIAFSATAGGTNLKPFILIPRKRPLKQFTSPSNVKVVYGTKGNFNESVMVEGYIPLNRH